MARLFQAHGAEVLFSTGLGGLTMGCNHQRDLKCFPRCALPPSHPSTIVWGLCVGQIAGSHALLALPRSLGGGEVLFLTCRHRENSASTALCMASQSPS
jgi:hypothetical protein